MQQLKKHLDTRLGVRPFCTVFDGELHRIWPRNVDQKRLDAIRKFAEENNYSVTITDPGIRVTFRKVEQPKATNGAARNGKRVGVEAASGEVMTRRAA